MFVLARQRTEYVGGAVGGVVVDDDDVVGERCLLGKCTLHGIANGLGPIKDWNDHRGLGREILLVEIDVSIGCGVDKCAECIEMSRAGAFHFNLHIAVARIYVVELPLATLACVQFDGRVEHLVQVEQQPLAAQRQTKVVPSGKPIGRITLGRSLFCPFLDRRRAEKHERAKVEVVAQRSFLIVDDRMALDGSS